MSVLRFDHAPLRVYWELTRACDLACQHCRAEAAPSRAPDELDTGECERVLRELASGGTAPHVIFTGGDPLKRSDLVSLVRYAIGLGLGVSVAPSATASVSEAAVTKLRAAGVSAMSLSIDGPTAALHDGLRGVPGCFDWTLVAARHITGAGIPLQINTLVTADSAPRLDEIGTVVAGLGADRWSLFFLIQVGRGRGLAPLTADECEKLLERIAASARRWPFTVTTTEAPHYRRIVVERMRAAGRSAAEIRQSPVARGFGLRDGNGIMFIAANGDVTPSGFLPLVAGNVRAASPLAIYREAPLFTSLRAPEAFHGRCGICSYRIICGGSRARAYAATGDVLGEDPLCPWEPAAAGKHSASERTVVPSGG